MPTESISRIWEMGSGKVCSQTIAITARWARAAVLLVALSLLSGCITGPKHQFAVLFSIPCGPSLLKNGGFEDEEGSFSGRER